jgi:hypothetical protein
VGSRRDCTWILGLPGFRVEIIDGTNAEATCRVLKGDNGSYRPAARLGIFAVHNSSIVPLVTQSEADHIQFKGMNEKAFVSTWQSHCTSR